MDKRLKNARIEEELPKVAPSRDAKIRILSFCEAEMLKRRERERRELRYSWVVTFGIAALLILNTLTEYSFSAKISGIFIEPRLEAERIASPTTILAMKARMKQLMDDTQDPSLTTAYLSDMLKR